MDPYWLLIFLICLLVGLSVAALICAFNQINNTPGPKGDTGDPGPKGDPGQNGTTIFANTLSSIPLTVEVSLFQDLSPSSTILIPANSLEIGDTFRLKITGASFSSDSFGSTSVIFGLESGSEFMNVSISDDMHPLRFELVCDITLNTSTSVNSMWTLTKIDDSLVITSADSLYIPNISFDSTIDQTFLLTGASINQESSAINEIMLTKMV